MCGIAGYVGTENDRPEGGPSPMLRAHGRRVCGIAGRMMKAFSPRPAWGWRCGGSALSISQAGGSRSRTRTGRIHVICNGEIYNYVELRAGLEARGHRLTTQGDVETIVHLYEEHGVELLRHLRGMFAFALWDSRKQTLFLARDRLGKKPLNYVVADGALTFSSELAPLLEQKLAPWEIDPDALAAYLQFGFISAPRTIVRQIKKLPPAHYLLWRAGEIEVRRYWSFQQEPKIACSYEEARERVRADAG